MIISKSCTIYVDPSTQYQKIDGFGANVNTKCWAGGELRPVIDQMIDELGATIFRLDCFGKADWVDPDGTGSEEDLYGKGTETAFASVDFANMCALSRHLNERGIEPYVTISGDAPKWMCGEDGYHLVRYDLYAEMVAEFAKRLRDAGVKFHLFGPFNECDLSHPEGVGLTPEEFVPACRAVVDALDRKGLSDVRLVLAEQSDFNLKFVQLLAADPVLKERMEVSSMHFYCETRIDEWTGYLAQNLPSAHAWATEFGSLEQEDSAEDSYAWDCVRRLFTVLSGGAQAALAWDAFDNYHDHDEAWTSFGLYQNSRGMFFPKKRFFFCKHLFRYVRPGFRRIAVSGSDDGIRLLAFASEDGEKITVVGMNETDRTLRGTFDREWYRGDAALGYLDYEVYLSDDTLDCARVTRHAVLPQNNACKGLDFVIPPRSVFTVTNVK